MPHSTTRKRTRAFTLVEVVLAIVIALGILVVLLYFYQQATNLRSEAIQETERLAAARLVMDRITSELRTIQLESYAGAGFVGRSNSLQFLKADVPSFASWIGGTLGRSAAPVTDLKRIQYRLESDDGTNITGLVRTEEPVVSLVEARAATEDEGTNSVSAANLPTVLPEIRFLQFRYWSGTNWLDRWSAPGSPVSVEVQLGAEPLPVGADMHEYEAEVFRRVIYIARETSSQSRRSGREAADRSSESGDAL